MQYVIWESEKAIKPPLHTMSQLEDHLKPLFVKFVWEIRKNYHKETNNKSKFKFWGHFWFNINIFGTTDDSSNFHSNNFDGGFGIRGSVFNPHLKCSLQIFLSHALFSIFCLLVWKRDAEHPPACCDLTNVHDFGHGR